MKLISIKKTLLLTIVCTMSACNSSTNSTIDQTGAAYTSAYVCPMHCEGSGSNSAGICPTCEMDYVKNNQEEK